MPWNAMITAMPYFLARLTGSPFLSSFASWLSVTWTLMSFTSLGFATWTAENTIPAIRVVLPLACNTLLVVSLAITPHVAFLPGLLFALVLANGALQAAFGAYLQTSIIALASAFGPEAIAAYMTGGAFVAVGVSLLKLSTAYAVLASVDDKYPAIRPDTALILGLHGGTAARGATTYFCMAAVFISAGIIAYAYLYPRIPRDVLKHDTPGHDSEAESDEPSEVDYLLGRVSRTPIPISTTSIWIVARKNACYNIAVFYIFVVTLALFPAITTSIVSVNSPTHSSIFNPLIFSALHFLNFNLADLVGRALTSFKSISPTSNKSLLVYSLARTAFIPLVLLCNVQHKPHFNLIDKIQPGHKPYINSDILYMLILFAFGVTNGHASTLVLMAAPSKVLNPRLELYESKTAARIAQFCLVGGLVVGSAASFGLRAIQCRCNPFVDG
ncbi:hypothetical protein FRC08_003529 [Ceratobasidium sp. 394]|nr:hypothetical protein FRC08_003529 [Ceratobasidium sp. 394]